MLLLTSGSVKEREREREREREETCHIHFASCHEHVVISHVLSHTQSKNKHTKMIEKAHMNMNNEPTQHMFSTGTHHKILMTPIVAHRAHEHGLSDNRGLFSEISHFQWGNALITRWWCRLRRRRRRRRGSSRASHHEFIL